MSDPEVALRHRTVGLPIEHAEVLVAINPTERTTPAADATNRQLGDGCVRAIDASFAATP